jgi:AMMECR1 domain-containing protein
MRIAGLSLVPLLLLLAGPAQSQIPGGPLELTGPQKKILLLIAREAVDAVLDNRPSREATVEPRLMEPQPMAVSIYVDGALRARAWRLRETQPIYLTARDLVYQALNTPKVSEEVLTAEELARAEVGVAVLSNYNQAKNETEVPPRSAVIIYNGFTEWLALPGDVPSEKAADLLTYACEQAGLRPRVWLLPQTTIYSAAVEELRESAPGGR